MFIKWSFENKYGGYKLQQVDYLIHYRIFSSYNCWMIMGYIFSLFFNGSTKKKFSTITS
jgi:hypothetical protein